MSWTRIAAILLGLAATGFLVMVLLSAVLWPAIPDSARMSPTQSFADGGSTEPRLGVWEAVGTYTSRRGIGGRRVGEKITRAMRIDQACPDCPLVLMRTYADLPPARAKLVRRSDGWHASFPPIRFDCAQENGSTTEQVSNWVLRFGDDGRTLEAHERTFMFRPNCHYRETSIDWFASILA